MTYSRLVRWWWDDPEEPGRMRPDTPEVRALVPGLRREWPDTRSLPAQIVHGDVPLSNICVALDGDTAVFDLGFAAVRPRVHDLAYSVVFMVRALHGDSDPSRFAWEAVPRLLDAYEARADPPLSVAERRAIMSLAVAVTCSHVAIAMARDRRGMVELGAWLLTHPIMP